MKTTLAVLALWAIIGCTPFKEIQIEMVRAEVVKIDTIWRSSDPVRVITWRDSDDIQYISFASMNGRVYSVGSSLYVMRRK